MITHERLTYLLNYDPKTGIFTRKVYTSNFSKPGPIGYYEYEGYIRFMVDGKIHRAHRLAWFYVYKEWPEEEIDHINHNRADNRICNLRKANRSQNADNRRIFI